MHILCKFGPVSRNTFWVIALQPPNCENSESKMAKWPWKCRSRSPIIKSGLKTFLIHIMYEFGWNPGNGFWVIALHRGRRTDRQTDRRTDGQTDGCSRRQYPYGPKRRGVIMLHSKISHAISQLKRNTRMSLTWGPHWQPWQGSCDIDIWVKSVGSGVL